MKIGMQATNAHLDDDARPEDAPLIAKVLFAVAARLAPVDAVLRCSVGV